MQNGSVKKNEHKSVRFRASKLATYQGEWMKPCVGKNVLYIFGRQKIGTMVDPGCSACKISNIELQKSFRLQKSSSRISLHLRNQIRLWKPRHSEKGEEEHQISFRLHHRGYIAHAIGSCILGKQILFWNVKVIKSLECRLPILKNDFKILITISRLPICSV